MKSLILTSNPKSGNVMVMDYLNEHGHDINVQDFSGCTPLAWLTMSKQVSDLQLCGSGSMHP